MSNLRISDLRGVEKLEDGHMFMLAVDRSSNFRLTADELYGYIKKRFLADLDPRDVAERIYPIGSVYIQAENSVLPFQDMFTWTLISKGRCIQTRSAKYAVGDEIAPGAPAIIESFKLNPEMLKHTHDVTDPGHYHSTGNMSGGIHRGHHKKDYQDLPRTYRSSTDLAYTGITVGAAVYTDKFKEISIKLRHDADQIYGKSDTVQPPAFLVNIYKRTA